MSGQGDGSLAYSTVMCLQLWLTDSFSETKFKVPDSGELPICYQYSEIVWRSGPSSDGRLGRYLEVLLNSKYQSVMAY